MNTDDWTEGEAALVRLYMDVSGRSESAARDVLMHLWPENGLDRNGTRPPAATRIEQLFEHNGATRGIERN